MASSDGKKNGLLIAYDAMVAPGRSVSLRADLVEAGFLMHSPLGGERILFRHKEEVLVRALTGGDGRAVASVTLRTVGVVTFTAQVEESRRVTAPEATAAIFVRDRKRPIVIISVQALFSSSRQPDVGLPFPSAGAKLQSPDGDAVRALEAVTRRVDVLYVTVRDRLELPEVRGWMTQHRLPPGPIFPFRHGPAGLAGELERWRQEGWTAIKGGLVGTVEEARAMLEKGYKAVVPPPASLRGTKWPDKAVIAKDWKEVIHQLS